MARAGVTVHETVNVSGHDAADVSRRVSDALAATGAYRVVELQPGRHQLVRTYRPNWALVAGTLGLAVFGLGALCFLVRRTELCTTSVTYGSTGSVLSIAGSLLPGHLDIATRAALEEMRGATGGAIPAVGPTETDPAADEPNVGLPLFIDSAEVADASGATSAEHFSDDVTVARPAVRPDTSSSISLMLADGRRLPLEGQVVIGRAPSWAPSPQSATLVAIDDPQMSISKTHLVITASSEALLVEDLHSTNGTEVAWPDGTRSALAPGTPVRLAAGAVLHFGGQAAALVGNG